MDSIYTDSQALPFFNQKMLIFIPFLISITTPLLMLGLHFIRPKFTRYWWIAALACFLILVSTGILRLLPDQEVLLTTWIPRSSIPAELMLRVDPLSWALAFSLAALGLAGVLTDVTRLAQANWSTWTGSIALTGLGILAVLSGNPLTLLLAWQAIDLAEVIVLLGQGYSSQDRQPIVLIFTIRLFGSILVIAAILIAAAEGQSLSFGNLSQISASFLLLGATVRFSALSFYTPILQRMPISRELGTIFRLVPAAASLVLINRAAVVGAGGTIGLILTVFASALAVYCAIAWSLARDEIAGRRFWMLAVASFALASAIRAQPQASLTWSLVLILPGGMLFLASVRNRPAQALLYIGLACFSTLPFTPAWSGLYLYSPPFQPWLVFMILAQTFLMAGYARHTSRPTGAQTPMERSSRGVYLSGLIVLLAANILISLWNTTLWNGPPLTQSWPVLVMIGLASLAFVGIRRGLHLPVNTTRILRDFLSFGWVYSLLQWLYRGIHQAVNFTTLILEGEGGVLWSLLLLTLLLSALIGVTAASGTGR